MTTLFAIAAISKISDSERNPPATSTGIDTEFTIFFIISRLSPSDKVASKSTTCNMSAPSASHFFAIPTGSSLYTVF
ncbi:MAG: hypothetical protein MAG458_00851 [Nitrosopumilus sp.]|nr:hypothetical protein [Nitrosopumilus sp.]